MHSYQGKYYIFVTLHNNDALIEQPSEEWRPSYRGRDAQHHMRGTQIFVGDSPEGPFQPLANRPAPPENFMALDGTLYMENGTPWMVYCHEWIQILDGTVEAIQLTPDLANAPSGSLSHCSHRASVLGSTPRRFAASF